MTTFSQFKAKCKMRPDFADQIQVRYSHSNGENYDTWVSGEEVIQRLASAATEQRLSGLNQTDLQQLKRLIESLPNRTKQHLRSELIDRLTQTAGDFLGDNIIGSSLIDGLTDAKVEADPTDFDRATWASFLQNPVFRGQVLELAWIQLEGSFPDQESPLEPDDWI